MDFHLSYVQLLLLKSENSYLFKAQYRQHIKSTTSPTDLCKCMTVKVIKHINLIREMKSFMKPDYNIYIEEHLTIIKKVCDKNFTFMNKIIVEIRGLPEQYEFLSILTEHWGSR